MNTVRISPVEVQVGAVIYQFLDAEVANGFLVVANDGANDKLVQIKSLALRSRPVDCDHELGSLHD
jgi:hypothetical protein